MEKQKVRLSEYAYLPEGSLIGSDINNYYTSSLKTLEKAMEKGVILEAVATVCDCADMSLRVDFGFAVGIIPKEEAMFADEMKDIAVITRVGKPVCFKIKKILYNESPVRVILSRRDAQIDCAENFTARLIPGDIIRASVTHLDPFGAFVDIGCGIISLITVDCISVSRIFHPSDRLYVGQTVYAAVKSIDRESGRIYMTLREMLGTWEENAESFTSFSSVAGIVRSIEDYGIFVELSPNLAGLAEVRPGVEIGDFCTVYIKNIIPDRMKIKLVIIDSRPGATVTPLTYFIDTTRTKHIDYWRYSPQFCKKVIETRFS